jgi:hypothetical protein
VRFVEWVDSAAELGRHVSQKPRRRVARRRAKAVRVSPWKRWRAATPVVSTPVGVMRELVRSGENGELVGFDVESLADGLHSVLADETRRRALGARAARDAQRFEYARTIRNYANGLKALVASRRGPRETPVPDAGDRRERRRPRFRSAVDRGLAAHCERVRVVALEAGDTRALPANADVRVVGRTGVIGRYLRYRRSCAKRLNERRFRRRARAHGSALRARRRGARATKWRATLLVVHARDRRRTTLTR